ncbi:MAG TPA: hypothetical protein VHF89_03475 [Solirubrobacteraceae bacterium]|nr:hypothetical protein [Solirubrobacteraceae bacterium]
MSPKSMLTLLAALAVVLALPAAAPAAKTNIAVGIGDQSPDMFDNADFRALKMKKARFFISWNAIDNPDKLAVADAWLRGAKRAGVRPLLHVDGVFTTDAPSVSEYRTKVRELVRRYRRGTDGRASVVEWGVWNEANSRTQPVFRLASRTAKYFLELRKMCRGCTIVALDLLDAGNIKAYIRSFYRALRGRKRLATIVGIHNYGDTNRARRNNTKTIINEVRRFNRRAKFWMTETGGLAFFRTETRVAFPCNESRQARAVAKMFALARKYRRYVTRLYPYNFFGTDCDNGLRFDAGLIRRDGSRRPAYNTLRRALRNFRR